MPMHRICILLVMSMMIFPACDDQALDKLDALFGYGNKGEESAKDMQDPLNMPAEGAKTGIADASPSGKADGTPPVQRGDLVLGWSKDARYLALREEHRTEGETAYGLHLVPTSLGRPSVEKHGKLYVSTKEMDIENLSWERQEEETIREFNRRAGTLLKRHQFDQPSSPGKLLFDRGSYLERFPMEKIPLSYSEDVDFEKAGFRQLLVQVTTREMADAGEAALESAFQVDIKKTGGAGAEESVRLQDSGIYLAGVGGLWLRQALLSPDGTKLALLFEAYGERQSSERAAGRLHLFAVSYDLERPNPSYDGVHSVDSPDFTKGKKKALRQRKKKRKKGKVKKSAKRKPGRKKSGTKAKSEK